MCTHVCRWDWGWQVNSDWLTLQDQLSRWEENNNLSTYHMPSRPLSLPLSLSLSLSLPPSILHRSLLSTNHPIMYMYVSSLESIESPIGMHVPLQPQQWFGWSAVPLLSFEWVDKIPRRWGHSSPTCSLANIIGLSSLAHWRASVYWKPQKLIQGMFCWVFKSEEAICDGRWIDTCGHLLCWRIFPVIILVIKNRRLSSSLLGRRGERDWQEGKKLRRVCCPIV